MRDTLLRLLQPAKLPHVDCRAGKACGTVCLAALWMVTALWMWSSVALCAAGGRQAVVAEPSLTPAANIRVGSRKFLAGRRTENGSGRVAALARARQQQAAMLTRPRDASLAAVWQAVGPLQIGSLAYGEVSGRITAIAIDPADVTGNTVYIGTTGGGVWKSTNAAGAASSVTFAPLTDTLPVFSPATSDATVASLSIGALSVANGVVLAGTGDPNDALDSYYGSGLLRSSDGGATWTLIQDTQDGVYGQHSFLGLGFAGLAWSTATPSIAVAAVSDAAEGVFENATTAIASVRGLYYSTDAGVTWQMAVIKDGSQVVQSPQANGQNHGGNAATAVVWNPVRQRFYAAIRYHGYYESVDGSVWTRLPAQPGTGLTAAACPADPGSTGSASCPIFRGALAVQPFSGDTFAFTVDAQNRDQGIWRDVCAASNSTCTNSQVAFGSRLNTAVLEQGGGSTAILQGDYDLSLAAVASGADTLVFAGTIDLYRCSMAAGCGFRNTTNVQNGCSAPAMVGPAQHAVAAFTGGALPLLYFGNDGGLWRSTDGVDEQGAPCSSDDAGHFQNLNGGLGSLAEVVSFSQDPSEADTLLVGVGANGTAATGAASSNKPWPQLAAGEGGSNAIDPASTANWYISTAPGVAISYCGKGSACAATDFAGFPTIGPEQVNNDASLIDPPWLLDPSLTSDVILGTCRVWRGPAADGSGWNATDALSADFGSTKSATCAAGNSFVRSLAAGGPRSSAAPPANAGSQVLYAGLAGVLDGGGSLGGHLFSTSAGNVAGPSTIWTDVALSPVANDAASGGVFNPSGFDVSSITTDPHDPLGGTVYATLTGFGGNGINAPHAYRSIDAGAHWTDITSNLPNAPANSLVVDPNDANTVYIALDTGVYATTQVASCATANCWSVYGSVLPNSPVVELAASASLTAGNGSTGLLRAATYGRGIWQIPLLSAAVPTSAQIAVDPQALEFPTQVVGSVSSAKTITIVNSGTAPLIVSSLAVTGSFQETDNCTGAPVAAGGSCAAQVVFFAASPGMNTGALTVYANIAGGQSSASLSGIGAAPASVVLIPLSLDFGLLTVGQTSPPQSITISNTGGVTAALQVPTVAGDFQITANTCGTALPAGVSCSVAIVFTPATAGTRNGAFTIVDSAGTQNTSLTGRGASIATDTLSPAALTFAPLLVGSTSARSTVTLTNSGDTALTLVAAQITSGDFIVVSGCGSSLSGHAACTLQVAFAPSVAGAQTGTLTVSDQFRSQTVTLSGSGLAPPGIRLSPATLSFADTAVGQSTSTQTVTITNSGSGKLSIASISVSGYFTQTNNCAGATLSGTGTACAAKVSFSPTSTGSQSGVLTVTGDGPGEQATATLNGAGLAPANIVFDPLSLSFGTVALGSSSAAQNITISNTGGVGTTLQKFTVTGEFKISVTTCQGPLPAGTGCTVGMVFVPTASGTRSGTLVLADFTSTQTVALTGVGASAATDGLSPGTLSFSAQQTGTTSAPQSVTLTNTGDNSLTLIALQVSNGNFAVTNGCGAVLAGHSSCTIAVASTPTINGATSAVLTVSDQFRSQTVSLSGSGVAPAGVQLSPAAVSFTSIAIGQTSPSQTVQISNFGGGQLTVTSVAVSGDFAESDSCAGKILSGSATCAVQVTFSPGAGGSRSGILTVAGSTPGSNLLLQATAALSGTGNLPAAIVLNPSSANFGTVTLGSASSPALNVTVSNTGGVPATLQTPVVSGDFAISANTCGTTLAETTGCTVAIVFTPTASGLRSGVFSLTDSAGTQTAALNGTGASAATDGLSPPMLGFSPQQVSTTSAAQTVTLTNAGDNPLTLIAVQVSGGNFSAMNDCGAALSGHSTCAIAVVSNPVTVGPTSGLLTVSDQFRSQTVALSGSGLAPPGVSLSPATAMTFAATGVTKISAPQTVTLSNQGGSPLVVSGISATGDFSVPVASNTCTASLAAGAACTFQVVFGPTSAGPQAGSITVTDNAAGSPQTISLQGIGVDFALNANGATTVSVTSGVSAVFPLLLSSLAGVPGDAAMSCTGAPANSTCVIVPASVPLGGTTTLTATVETGLAAGAAANSRHERGWRRPGEILWAMCLPALIAFYRLRDRTVSSTRVVKLLSLILMMCLLGGLGCGAGRLIPGSPGEPGGPTQPSTPNGTYPITVSASSAGLTRSVTVTLVLN